MKEVFEPLHIIWHVTNNCNASCKYCFTSSFYSAKTYTNPSSEIVVNKINKEKSVKRVSIIGGESLLLKELPEILKNLRKDIIINIDSNLIKIREVWDNSFKRAYFCTTIDSIDEKIHNKTRTHSVKDTIEGIKFLLEKGVKVMVIIVVSKHNVETLEKTARYLFELGVDKIGISRVRMSGRALKFSYEYFYDNLEKTKQETLKAIKNLVKDYGKERILVYNLWYDNRFFDLGYKYEPSCKCALFRACIDWEGYVYPCELMPFYWEEFYNVYGLERLNLKDFELSEIFYNSELFKFFRKRMLYYPVGSEKCKNKEICNHGCRFYSFLISTILSSKDITCGANSVYDVIGYHYYSPLSSIGRERWNSETAKIIKSLSSELGKKVYDLGCGGGIWSFFLENLGKQVIGIDNNKTMILIALEYKNMKNKKTRFVFSDLRKYNFENFDSAIMMDNVIFCLSKKEFENLLEKLKSKVKKLLIEISKKGLKEGKYEYKFNNFDIQETVKKIENDIYERSFLNRQTGSRFTILSHAWDKEKLEKVLRKYGKIKVRKETNKSYLYLVEF